MPSFKSKKGNSFHAMNPARAKQLAAADDDAGENLDQANNTSDATLNEGDYSDVLPEGHKLTNMNVTPSDNGGGNVEHTTEPIAPPGKGDDSFGRRVEHNNSFGDDDEVGKHVGRVLKAHHARLGGG